MRNMFKVNNKDNQNDVNEVRFLLLTEKYYLKKYFQSTTLDKFYVRNLMYHSHL